ncbi:hypothetical protein GCM10025867_01550 [Frondihabitans sucicola]|uniref:Uncharacterized protein n=1 Tax=Frondihabitans sucicola TaxID=1268041 RepID=A0ABM8GHR4_9MICO|nr:hypothetical protein [Frondihabitans sucicola]BDZ47914.1 hypothetical protein GCM10025867_01550 [Frondihabitans sucicola]
MPSPLPSDEADAVRASVLGARYWWDEPGDQGALCYHTENHQALFHSAEIAAGTLFPDVVFAGSGLAGRAAVDHGAARFRRWAALRARWGWSEWLSNTYTQHNVLALCSIVDGSDDADLREVATSLLDILFVEIAANSWRGILGSTHGRAYVPGLLDGSTDGATTLLWLTTGLGVMADTASVGGSPSRPARIGRRPPSPTSPARRPRRRRPGSVRASTS